MQYNYHCNRVVILKLELVQFWLFLAVFGTPLTRSFPIKINPHKTFIYITVNILRYSIIWEIVFPQYFNKKLFLFVDLYLSLDKLTRKLYLSLDKLARKLYLSLDKLARKLYLSGKFYVRVGWVGHGKFHTHGSWVLTSWFLITQDLVSLSLIDWLKTWSCTGCYLIVFFSLPQSCILTRDASSTTYILGLSERVIVVNIKWEIFQLYHGEIKLHFEEMMFALY